MSDLTLTVSNDIVVDAEALRVSGGTVVDAEALRVREDISSSSDAMGHRVYVPAQSFETAVVTVKTATKTAYAYCARAARRFRWFITVRASALAVVLESRVRAFINNVFPKTGADILCQSAILNI